jgi:uncharacterized protein YdiU (UPF0061 family)
MVCLPVRRFYRAISVALLVFLTGTGNVLGTDWDEISNGEHSFRQLGAEYFVEVPMKHMEGAELRLFSRRAASAIGLEAALKPEALGKWVTDRFALFVDPTGKSPLKLIATRYQDSPTRNIGDALGDGRAVWIGELRIPRPDGRILYLDVTLKGAGATPLAWKNHSNPAHSDGLQKMEEAIHSFIYSEANIDNGIRSTVDLAVLEIPLSKPGPDGKPMRSAITVRVGKQTRLAHLRYFADQPKQFRKIFDYIVRRDLGLPLASKVTNSHRIEYVDGFVKALAEDTARYYDLHAVHGSPTSGNKTTQGTTIDNGTFRYLDAHHPEYAYLFEKLELGGTFGQVAQQKDYIEDLIDYLKRGRALSGYSPLLGYGTLLRKSLTQFDHILEARLTETFLSRIGLLETERLRLTPKTKHDFYQAAKSLYEVKGSRRIPNGNGRNIVPAGIDVRKVFRNTAQAAGEGRTQAWQEAFRTERGWGSLSTKDVEPHLRRYRSAVESIVKELEPSHGQRKTWMARSRAIHANERVAPGEHFYYSGEKYHHSRQVEEALARGASHTELTELALDAAKRLTDEGLEAETRGQFCAGLVLPTLQELVMERAK